MKKLKNNYTNFILTVIAVAMIGILFKGEINKPAQADDMQELAYVIKTVVQRDCWARKQGANTSRIICQ